VEIRIQYKDVTAGIFDDIARNELVIRIQPSEAIYMKFNTKTPGLITRAIPTELDLTYKSRFAEAKIPEAYEALILDAFKGDHSNFVRDDELDVAWKVRCVVQAVDSFAHLLHDIDATLIPFSYRSSPRSSTGSTVKTARRPSPRNTLTDLVDPSRLTSLRASTGSSGRTRDSESQVAACLIPYLHVG
jgi:hypothetical protein